MKIKINKTELTSIINTCGFLKNKNPTCDGCYWISVCDGLCEKIGCKPYEMNKKELRSILYEELNDENEKKLQSI